MFVTRLLRYAPPRYEVIVQISLQENGKKESERSREFKERQERREKENSDLLRRLLASKTLNNQFASLFLWFQRLSGHFLTLGPKSSQIELVVDPLTGSVMTEWPRISLVRNGSIIREHYSLLDP